MTRVEDLFEVRYGHSLQLNRLTVTSQASGIALVSRKMGDNGIAAYVEPIPGVLPAPAGELSCALSGNGVLSTFVQDKPFYTAFHVACLKPRYEMTRMELLYYCACIKANRYRYSYGRQANRTLKDILVPALSEVPSWVNGFDSSIYEGANAPANEGLIELGDPSTWKAYRYDEIFEIRKGYYNKKPPRVERPGELDIPFIGASEKNNGITSFVSLANLQDYSRDGSINPNEDVNRKLFPPGAITVPNNGASVGEAFYQRKAFTCTHDVNPLYLKDKSVVMNEAIGLFLTAVIRAEKYRWSYGRKWRPIRMPYSIIRLPSTDQGVPDWAFMQTFIRALPYSSKIGPVDK
ncbi:restriction endonuclease subunit S [Pseudomonas alliivorans]|nr:restriction endonuclease subunit S [Pseudomonas alliivorans]MEE4795935.1 restriction endonuclease subunit S [Pseudomonas alliivorans]MEE4800963.1 restriction endonuclease subunit S [Pseudomonas alliivorans]MEE4811084.1 restriction endonuclease subunit S [Pseudomonas alliivorans]MEE4826267.1 restriction endonuclease subunit S [Pseudomonas alliivorans]